MRALFVQTGYDGQITQRRLWEMLGLGGLIALAMLLCCFSLGARTLWNDEAFSFFVAWQGPARVLAVMPDDAQPPFYYLALSQWLRLGHDVLTLRLFSALAIIATVPPGYFALRRLLGMRTALIAMLIFITNPAPILWSHVARPYALQTLLVIVSFWGFARIWTDERAERVTIGAGVAGLPRRAGGLGTDLAWLAYAVGGALAILTQYPAGFFIAACNLAMLVRLWRGPRQGSKPGRLLLNWLTAQVILLAVWFCWLPQMLSQITAHLSVAAIAARHRVYLIQPDEFIEGLYRLFGSRDIWRGREEITLLFAGLALIGALRLARTGRGLPLPLMLVGVVAAMLGCYLGLHPIFGYVLLNFIWLLPLYHAAMATSLLAMPRWVGLSLLVAILLMQGWGLRNLYAEPTVRYDIIAARISAAYAPGDGLILAADGAPRWALAYYLGPKLLGPKLANIDGLDVDSLRLEGLITTPTAALRHPRIWLVLPEHAAPALEPLALLPEMRVITSEMISDTRLLLLSR